MRALSAGRLPGPEPGRPGGRGHEGFDYRDFVAVLVLYVLFSLAVEDAVSMPVVHRSWSSQECVEVFSKDPAHDWTTTCRAKYSNVWVQ